MAHSCRQTQLGGPLQNVLLFHLLYDSVFSPCYFYPRCTGCAVIATFAGLKEGIMEGMVRSPLVEALPI